MGKTKLIQLKLTLFSLLFSTSLLADGPNITECPESFHSVVLHNEAQLCQIFDSVSPASLIYYIKESPNDAISFFLKDPTLSVSSTNHERTLLMNASKEHRVVISPDGTGSQIDILVITPKS